MTLSKCLDDLLMFIYFKNRWNIFPVLVKKNPQSLKGIHQRFVATRKMSVYQLLLQGFNPVLIKSFLLRQLFLSHLFCHLNSLHHLLFCLQMGFFNFCLQSGTNQNDSLFQDSMWSCYISRRFLYSLSPLSCQKLVFCKLKVFMALACACPT